QGGRIGTTALTGSWGGSNPTAAAASQRRRSHAAAHEEAELISLRNDQNNRGGRRFLHRFVHRRWPELRRRVRRNRSSKSLPDRAPRALPSKTRARSGGRSSRRRPRVSCSSCPCLAVARA